MKKLVYRGSGCLYTAAGVVTPNQIVTEAHGLSEGEIKHYLSTGILEEVGTEVLAVDDKAPKPPAPVLQFPANWGFTAERLAGKSLEDLNILIAEHAGRLKVQMPPICSTVEEAVAILGSDL
jgi:hypothetical protein